MSRLMLISRSWPNHERSGVALAAGAHARALATAGHQIMIVGSDAAVAATDLPVAAAEHIRASGSGALYSPSRLDAEGAARLIQRWDPSLVLVEAWQTALTDGFVDLASALGRKVIMLSHGISIHPYVHRPRDWARALAWAPYALRKLPRRIRALTSITTLDMHATSTRFADRDLAVATGKPVFELGNSPVHVAALRRPRQARKAVMLLVGYFSEVKNQLAAIELMHRLRHTGLSLRLLGPASGAYFARCRERVAQLSLQSQVSFVEDTECDVAEEIAQAYCVLSTSITEALPITLLEAMASGTPFVATPVGAVPSLKGGLIAKDIPALADAVSRLLGDTALWQRLAQEGSSLHESRYTVERIGKQLLTAVDHGLQA
jgi:glycosyltransferase involved in cell wall biosynthesis